MIRFKKVGRRNQQSFRLVVVPKEAGSRAEPIEFLGSWNPRTKAVTLKEERVRHWLSQGAKPSASAHNLLVSQGIIAEGKIAVHKKAKEKEGVLQTSTQVAGGSPPESPEREAAPAETPPESAAEATPAQT